MYGDNMNRLQVGVIYVTHHPEVYGSIVLVNIITSNINGNIDAEYDVDFGLNISHCRFKYLEPMVCL